MDGGFSEKSYRVLEILSQDRELSQRELALRTGLSLGMVNLVIKRLVKTGCLKVAGLNRKKMDYILTPKGLGEKMVRSYQYFLRACRTFQESQSRIEAMVSALLAKGHRNFLILGEGEVTGLVEMCLRAKGGESVRIRRAARDTTAAAEEIALDCRLGSNAGSLGISVLEEILSSQDGARGAWDVRLPVASH